MNKLFYQPFKFAVVGAALCASVTGARSQSFTMQIVADNDFAVFAGTTTGVTSLIYQNDFSWPDQLANLSSFSFALQPGDTTFYLLGLGGGGVENISGTVNDVDITTINVSMSSDIGPFLTGYEAQSQSGTVADGSFDVNLADVQAAFPALTWGSPTPTDPDIDDVADQSPTGQGFHFDPSTAHLFSFDASEVGVTPVPEPSTIALATLGGLGSLIMLRRRN